VALGARAATLRLKRELMRAGPGVWVRN